MSILERIEKIKMDLGDVDLVIATKSATMTTLEQICKHGHYHFAENRVQDFLERYQKLSHLRDNITWSFIGPLQTNKVKAIIDKVDLIQSLDRLELAAEINKRAIQIKKKQKVLIEIKVAHDGNKTGFDIKQIEKKISLLNEMSNIEYCGVMAIAPNTENISMIESSFSTARDLFLKIKKTIKDQNSFHILSMGMSSDYRLAIKCGSNMVRIGSLIFKE